MSLFLILLASGESKRFKSNVPKPFYRINDKVVLEHALDAFKNHSEIKKTIIVYNRKHKKFLNKLSLKNIIKENIAINIEGNNVVAEKKTTYLKLVCDSNLPSLLCLKIL